MRFWPTSVPSVSYTHLDVYKRQVVGSMILEAGFSDQLVCCASSHFSTAERQFRFPLEMGAQKTPSQQRTATGAGATILSTKEQKGAVSYTHLAKFYQYLPNADLAKHRFVTHDMARVVHVQKVLETMRMPQGDVYKRQAYNGWNS